MAGEIKTDTISENTATAGVTIDSVLLKDGGATLSGAIATPTKLTLNQTGVDDSLDIQDGGNSVLKIHDGGIVDTPLQSGVRVSLSADQENVASVTYVKINFNNKIFDTQSEYDNVTNYRFTATKAGYYQVNLNLYYYTTPVDQKFYDALIFKNGAMDSQGRQMASGTSGLTAMASNILYLDVNDFVEGYAYHNTGAAVKVYSGISYMSIHKLS